MKNEEIISLCERLGTLESFEKNESMFGNYIVKIRTSQNENLIVISDRGHLFAYIESDMLHRKKHLHKNVFNNLIDLVDYLESIFVNK